MFCSARGQPGAVGTLGGIPPQATHTRTVVMTLTLDTTTSQVSTTPNHPAIALTQPDTPSTGAKTTTRNRQQKRTQCRSACCTNHCAVGITTQPDHLEQSSVAVTLYGNQDTMQHEQVHCGKQNGHVCKSNRRSALSAQECGAQGGMDTLPGWMQVDTDKACRQAHTHGPYCDTLHKTYSCVAHQWRAKQVASQANGQGHTLLLPAEL